MERDGVIMKLRRFLLMGLCLVFLFTAFTGCTPKQTTQTPLEFYTAYMDTAKNGSPEEIASYLYFPNEEEKQFHMASFSETEGDNYASYEITETRSMIALPLFTFVWLCPMGENPRAGILLRPGRTATILLF